MGGMIVEFELEDGYKIKITQNEDKERLIVESFDDKGNFLERNWIHKEDLYPKLF
jgi:hypothetical protein